MMFWRCGESWGINMKTDGHYEFTGHAWPGSSGKKGESGKIDRTWIHFSDNNMCPKLEKQVREKNVRIMNRVFITELIKGANGRIVGAIGINTRTPKLYIFKTKSIIINKGAVSPGRLYPPPDLIGYSMAEPGTGSGLMMAYRVGAELQDAEKCLRQVSLRFGPFAGKGTWIGVTVDDTGKPIAPPYLPKPDRELGDPAIENADAIDHIWKMGRAPVWMDPRGISEADESYMKWGFESEGMLPFLRWLDQEKIDIRKTRFEFASRQPWCLMQLRVDRNLRTTIDGLYGIPVGHLSFSSVNGLIAGRSAAEDGRLVASPDIQAHRRYISEIRQSYEEILNRDGLQYADWREVQWAIYQVMHCYAMPPKRTEGTLKAGYHQLLRLRERARKMIKATNSHDLYHCIEVLNLLEVAELVILAVKERKESRGPSTKNGLSIYKSNA